VTVDDTPRRASYALVGGERVILRQPAAEAVLRAESGELEVLFEDEDLLAFDKPAGLVVHPGAGRSRGTLLNRILGRYPEIGAVGSPKRPGIVHRLDVGTSGVLLVARSERAYQALSRAFEKRRMKKTYVAIVYGTPAASAATIDRPLARHPTRRVMMTVAPTGRAAVSHYRTVESREGISVLTVEIETGRTHQIRVHLKSAGHPVVGDPLYGEARWKGLAPGHRRVLRDFPRPALHAWRIELGHPVDGRPLCIEAPIAADLRQLWKELFALPLPVVDSEELAADSAVDAR